MNKKGYWYFMKKTQKKFSPKVLIPLSLALTFSTGMPNAYAETEISSINDIKDTVEIDGKSYKDIKGNNYLLNKTLDGTFYIKDTTNTGALTITASPNSFGVRTLANTDNLIQVNTLNIISSDYNGIEVTPNTDLTIVADKISINSAKNSIFLPLEDSTESTINSITIKDFSKLTFNSQTYTINNYSQNATINISSNKENSSISLNAKFYALHLDGNNSSTILSSENINIAGLYGINIKNNNNLDIIANKIDITGSSNAISNNDSIVNISTNSPYFQNEKIINLNGNLYLTMNSQTNISGDNTQININGKTIIFSGAEFLGFGNNSYFIFNGNVINQGLSSDIQTKFNIGNAEKISDIAINGQLNNYNSTSDIYSNNFIINGSFINGKTIANIFAKNDFIINTNIDNYCLDVNKTALVNISANNIILKNTSDNSNAILLSTSIQGKQSTLNLTGNNIHIEGTQNAVSLDNAILNINKSSDNSTTYNTTTGKIDFIGITELNNNSVAKILANNQDITFDGAVTVNDSEFTLNSTGGITEFTEGLTSNNANINLHFDGENTKLIGAINKGENINTDAPVGLDTNSNTTDLTLANGATWENTGASSLDSLTANDSTIIHNTEDDISIDNYSGSATINVSGSNDNGSFEVTSGNFIIGNAQENSSITLSMDNKDIIDTTNVDSAHEALNAMANKLVFTNSNDQNNNLTGKVIITEGLLTPITSANISFVTNDNQNNDGFVHIDDVIIPPTNEQPDEELPNPDDTQPAPPSNDEDNENPAPPEISDIEIGNKVTATMRAMRNVATASILSWQHEDNTLREQLYALQNNDDSFGVWTRFNRGEFEYANEFKNQYNLMQVGYDKFIKDSHYGIAFSHNDSTTSYGYGSGKNQSNSLSFYRTWHNDNNEYTHTILKVGHLDNDYNIYTAAGHTNGDYTTWATTLSHEYGKKINLSDKYFITPQVQLDYSCVFGADYTTNNGIYVEQDDLNSLVGRIGFNLGTSFNNQDNFFLKASISHQIAGTADTILHHGNITNNFTQDLGNTWYEIGLGSNVQVGEHTYLMADITKTFGDDLSTPWQYNLGLRWSFN